jgi:hypothetical protein
MTTRAPGKPLLKTLTKHVLTSVALTVAIVAAGHVLSYLFG